MSVKARGSITLIRVNDGEDGNDAITVSPTAPSNPVTGQLWQTASGNPIKRWDGSKWVVHYISVENLKTDSLSAISANLGAITAGSISINDKFSVTSLGVLTATSGTIGGINISLDKISAQGTSYDGFTSSYEIRSDGIISIENTGSGRNYSIDMRADKITITGMNETGSFTRSTSIGERSIVFKAPTESDKAFIGLGWIGNSDKLSGLIIESSNIMLEGNIYDEKGTQKYMFGLQSTYDF